MSVGTVIGTVIEFSILAAILLFVIWAVAAWILFILFMLSPLIAIGGLIAFIAGLVTGSVGLVVGGIICLAGGALVWKAPDLNFAGLVTGSAGLVAGGIVRLAGGALARKAPDLNPAGQRAGTSSDGEHRSYSIAPRQSRLTDMPCSGVSRGDHIRSRPSMSGDESAFQWDDDTARQVLREYDELVEAKSVDVYDHQLRPTLAELGRQAAEFAGALAPSLRRTGWAKVYGRQGVYIKPKAISALKCAGEWWDEKVPGLSRQFRGFEVATAIAAPWGDVWELVNDDLQFRSREKADAIFDQALGNLRDLPRQLQEEVRFTRLTMSDTASEPPGRSDGKWLLIPPDEHPPRHGCLKKGVLLHTLGEDLDDQASAGQALQALLTSGNMEGGAVREKVQKWSKDVKDHVLDCVAPHKGASGDFWAGFWTLTQGAQVCENPNIPDPGRLAAAYVALGLAYLEEVRTRMPDYAEAAAQHPPAAPVSTGTAIVPQVNAERDVYAAAGDLTVHNYFAGNDAQQQPDEEGQAKEP